VNNKLSLLVNFIGVDKMSGSLRNIVGLGGKGSKSIRALTGEARTLQREIARYDRLIATTSGNATALWDSQKRKMQELEDVQRQITRQQRLAAIGADSQALARRGADLKDRGQSNVIGGAAMAIPLVLATKQAMTFESAMADVRKVVDFPTPRAFAQMSDDVLTLSTRIPMAAEEIAAIVAAAGRANIPRKELLRFAEDSAKMGVAFDMTGDEAGAMMAKWRTAFSMGQTDVVRLSDQVNALTNRFGGNATAVAGIITRIGALGEVSGLAASQVGAMAQLLNSVGVEEEVAATGIKNMMLALTKGEAATKSQSTALASLGLNTTDLAERMQQDAGGAITDVLRRISRLPKAVQSGLLTQLFGSESIAAIAPMLTNLDKLQANLRLVGDQSAYAGSMNNEYLARIATTEGATGLAMNGLKALNMELGKQLLPTVTRAATSIVAITQSLRQWSSEHPQLASGIATFVSGLVAFRLGLGAAQFALGGLLGPLAKVLPYFRKVEGISRFGTHLKMFAGAAKTAASLAVRGFGLIRGAAMLLAQGVLRAGALMLTNPIVLIITGIVVALGVAAYLIYTHWDKIRAAFTKGVAWVKETIHGLPEWLKSIGKMMMTGLLMAINPMALADRLLSVARNGLTAFKKYFGIKSPSRVFMTMGDHLTTGLERGIDGGSRGPMRAVGKMAAGVMAAGSIALAPQVSLAAASLPKVMLPRPAAAPPLAAPPLLKAAAVTPASVPPRTDQHRDQAAPGVSASLLQRAIRTHAEAPRETPPPRAAAPPPVSRRLPTITLAMPPVPRTMAPVSPARLRGDAAANAPLNSVAALLQRAVRTMGAKRQGTETVRPQLAGAISVAPPVLPTLTLAMPRREVAARPRLVMPAPRPLEPIAPATASTRPAPPIPAAPAPITIYVYAAPGMDIDALVEEIERKLERAQQRRRRSIYEDET